MTNETKLTWQQENRQKAQKAIALVNEAMKILDSIETTAQYPKAATIQLRFGTDEIETFLIWIGGNYEEEPKRRDNLPSGTMRVHEGTDEDHRWIDYES